MTEIQMLEAIYNHIRDNGMEHPSVPGMGGVWSVDTYTLNDWTAQLADDGSSKIVRHGNFMANTTYGRPVQYFSTGDQADLAAFHNEVFPPQPLKEERSFYLWL